MVSPLTAAQTDQNKIDPGQGTYAPAGSFGAAHKEPLVSLMVGGLIDFSTS